MKSLTLKKQKHTKQNFNGAFRIRGIFKIEILLTALCMNINKLYLINIMNNLLGSHSQNWIGLGFGFGYTNEL